MYLKEPSNNNNDDDDDDDDDVELTTHKIRYISPEKRQQIINELRLIPKKMNILKNNWWI